MPPIAIPPLPAFPADCLQGQTVLITGAGNGIGAALAIGCARHGATVILTGRTERKLEEIYDAIEAAGGPKPIIHPIDLATAGADEYQILAHSISSELGHLDGLIHNAAILGNLTPLGQYDAATWAKVMQVNLYAPFLLTQALLPVLRAATASSVIFMSDRTGRQGKAYWGAYGVAKGGQETLMQIWADELETNTRVRMNSLDPGAIRTSLRARAYPGDDLSRLPLPSQVVPAILYLLRDGGSGNQYTLELA
jgi:NAD(P)-dependent dehydrogenase (short-subunit alcohol dehydrogenase family)